MASVLLLVFVVSALLTAWISRSGVSQLLMDQPNERSLHVQPTPQGGGLGILIASVLGLAWYAWQQDNVADEAWLLVAVIVLVAISLFDDLHPVSARLRLLVHFAAATSLLFFDVLPAELLFSGDIVAAILVLLFVVWMLNLFNFMDGMDGFAGGMSVIGFSFYASLAVMADANAFAWVAAILAFASAGFLLFNFPPAKIFLGDVGSVPLGFVAAAMTLIAHRDGIFPFWLGLLVFSPFIVDATLTLLLRGWRRERLTQAHRSHFYQRLAYESKLNWGHRGTVLREYGLMITCGLSALLANALDTALSSAVIGITWIAAYVMLALWLPKFWNDSA